ncbi:MAG TPA: hypothetical protein V6C84_24640 [Coleofasciculaceae cyanobacterium]|jgi:hypothetical protein
MPLFLITSLYDEGISPNNFRLIEADSTLAVAAHMLAHTQQWEFFLLRAFGDDLPLGILTPETLIERIDRTHVDGDSSAQLRITPVTVQTLEQIDTVPSFQSGAMFSDFG